jgi:hypothetical protein
MAKAKKTSKQSKSGSPTKKAAAKKPAAGAAQAYSFTAARRKELEASAAALGDGLITFPGRLKERVRWSQRIATAALRDAGDLVRTPFSGEPPLTVAEIGAQRDRIELMRLTESEYQAARAGQAAASKEFAQLAEQVTADRDLVLRALDVRFRNDPRGQKRVSSIRSGAGEADLVQDVSDILVLAAEQAAFLATCPRGEAAAVERLRAASPELSRLLGAKTISEDGRKARRLRDGAYTLVTLSERRIRAAADYWYAGTDKMKEYAAFPASSGAVPKSRPRERTGRRPRARARRRRKRARRRAVRPRLRRARRRPSRSSDGGAGRAGRHGSSGSLSLLLPGAPMAAVRSGSLPGPPSPPSPRDTLWLDVAWSLALRRRR